MVQPVPDLAGEYFAQEAASELKHEFDGYEIVAMAGASPRHNALQTAIGAALHRALGTNKCRTFGSDQRVAVEAGPRYFYPDVVVACSPRFDDRRPASLLNPRLTVEVSSPTTANRDRGIKLPAYYAVPTIYDVLLVATNQPLVEHHHRLSDDQWLVTLVRTGSIEFEDLSASLNLDEIYAGVSALPPDDETPPTGIGE